MCIERNISNIARTFLFFCLREQEVAVEKAMSWFGGSALKHTGQGLKKSV